MKCFAVSAALFLGCVPSFAAYTVQLTETGGNVVAVGNGTLNTTALAAPTPSGYNAFLISLNAVVIVGPESGTAVENRAGISGPISAGTSAALVIADTGSGDKVGVQGGSGALVTDSGYVSGTPLSSTSTWNGATFASLGFRWNCRLVHPAHRIGADDYIHVHRAGWRHFGRCPICHCSNGRRFWERGGLHYRRSCSGSVLHRRRHCQFYRRGNMRGQRKPSWRQRVRSGSSGSAEFQRGRGANGRTDQYPHP